jgi:hypothetical protein
MGDDRDPVLQDIVSNAFRRFDANLNTALPKSAGKLRERLHRVPTRPEHLFLPRSFPLVLSYWLSPSGKRNVDTEFQTDVIYSSINGYYSIRLCDNIADNDGAVDLRKLASCVLYFDNEAIRPYMNYFSHHEEFWKSLDEFLGQQADMSAADGLLDDVDAETFASVSSKKFTGSKIPLSALRYRYHRSHAEFEQWSQFVDCLGAFAQLNSDFFDWHHDSLHGIPTLVSSEAKRRGSGESLASWFLREGFDWGAAELRSRLNDVTLRAEALKNEAVVNWVIARGQTLESDIGKLRSGLKVLNILGGVLSGNPFDGGSRG